MGSLQELRRGKGRSLARRSGRPEGRRYMVRGVRMLVKIGREPELLQCEGIAMQCKSWVRGSSLGGCTPAISSGAAELAVSGDAGTGRCNCESRGKKSLGGLIELI